MVHARQPANPLDPSKPALFRVLQQPRLLLLEVESNSRLIAATVVLRIRRLAGRRRLTVLVAHVVLDAWSKKAGHVGERREDWGGNTYYSMK
jgi:hypothetical protein